MSALQLSCAIKATRFRTAIWVVRLMEWILLPGWDYESLKSPWGGSGVTEL
jgi:hypothetical protein